MNLKGRVKSISQKSFITSLGHKQAAPGDNAEQIADFDRTFNGAGYIILDITYGSKGKLSTQTFEYDAANRMLKSKHAMENGLLKSENSNKYNSTGNKIETISILTEIDTASTTIIETKTTYTYDVSNHLIESNETSSTNNVESEKKVRHVLEYDEDDNLKKTTVFENDKLAAEITYKYEGKILTESEVTADDGNFKNLQKYNNAGQLLSRKISGNFSQQKEFTYDENGHKISATYINDNSPRKATYTYKFDDKGNWIEQYQFYNNELTYTVYRTIEYWD